MMGNKTQLSTTTYTKEQLEKADRSLDRFISECSNEVFRDFLPAISKDYKVIPCDCKGEISDSVAYFEISRFVENDKEEMIDCLKSVYHVLSNSGCSVALVIHRKLNGCEIGLAVGNALGSSERTIKDTQRLQDAFKGNFPGSSCGEVKSESGKDSSILRQIASSYVEGKDMSLAIVSNVATEFADNYATQGIEKLLDGIRPTGPDTEYTLIITGEALKNEDLKQAKENLCKNYTALSPYVSEQKSFSITEAEQSNWNWSAIVFGHSWGSSTGADVGSSFEVTDYKVKHTLEVIEKQMERLEESAALGLWNYATYVVSPDLAVTNEVAHMFMSLTQGKESFGEQSAINVWNGQDSAEAEQIKDILSSLRYLRHPRFISKKNDKEDAVTATTIVSGAEFARSLSFPQKSVSGFPVFKCARFGRNVSVFGDRKIEPVWIGQIYHMRQPDETTPVTLDRKSLASHVFITGSTGSGKSNTVFRMLTRAKVPFLVIEPAKGEYKDIFGGEEGIKVYGTNPKVTELLRLNPFSFPECISVSEHIDRLVELFNVCWPMYAAMPAILKDAVIKAYEAAGWDIELSENRYDSSLFPTFGDVLDQIRTVLASSEYSADNKSDYTGALVTRLRSLTNGINGHIFGADEIDYKDLFDSKTIVDLSRVGSTETKALIMGLIVMKLQEYRMSSGKPDNGDLKHITVLEEAHNILKRTSTEQTSEGANLLGKSVEMLTNSIAELRSFGEGFVIADQAPGLLDMAVIRNTNTKIIHRLPDQSDRELAGRAAGLNEEQIEELAKLELGVAAIYQNDWIEPVLCQVFEYPDEEKKTYQYENKQGINKKTEEARKMLRDVLLKPNEFIRVDSSLIMRSNLPAQAKIMFLEISKGNPVREDQRAKVFYMLYPGIRLDFKKDDKGEYLNNLFNDIKDSCGELTPVEMKVASVYLLAVSSGFDRIKADEYKEIRKELMAHD